MPAKYVSMVRPGSDTTPDEYDQEKEYDEHLSIPEIYNQTPTLIPPLRKEAGLPVAIVVVTMVVTIVLLILLIVGSFSEFCFININIWEV